MALWKDKTGSLHDDMDGTALALASWPNGLVMLSEAEVAEVSSPRLTVAEQISALGFAVSAHVETVARARQYDSAAACVSYTESMVVPWRADANAMVAWRDAVWIQVISMQSAVLAGTIQVPTADALIASLPAIAWPE